MPPGVVSFFVGIATVWVGVVGRVLLVACSCACGLLLLNGLLSILQWLLTHDPRALVEATGFLTKAAIALTLTVEGAYHRKRLRRVLQARRARELAEAGPWDIR